MLLKRCRKTFHNINLDNDSNYSLSMYINYFCVILSRDSRKLVLKRLLDY